MRVVQESIEHRGRHGRIAGERRIPLRKRDVARDDDRTAFVPLRDRLEEVTRFFA